jgi:hypothetical protein
MLGRSQAISHRGEIENIQMTDRSMELHCQEDPVVKAQEEEMCRDNGKWRNQLNQR